MRTFYKPICIKSEYGNIYIKSTDNRKEVTLDELKKFKSIFEKEITIKKTANNDILLLLNKRKKYKLNLYSYGGNIIINEFLGDSINIETEHGKINITNCICDKLRTNTKYGDINIKNTIADNITIHTGDNENTINVFNSIANNISIYSHNGKINLQDVAASNKMTLFNITNYIEAQNTAAKKYEASTINSNIILNKVTTSKADIYTSSGDITITATEDSNITTKNYYGKIKVAYIKK